MRNKAFFDAIFPGDFWAEMGGTRFPEDEHSMFGEAPVFDWLIKTLQPEEIIEIGSWKGHSANYMADVARSVGVSPRIVCVDTFLGGPEHWILPGSMETLHRKFGRPTIFERFVGNTVARGNAGRLFPLTLDSASATHVFREHRYEADLIFVDGGHDPQVVIRDVMGYYALLGPNGVMFGDDYQDEHLAEAVHECARNLGVQVLVLGRKWILANQAFMRRLTLPNIELRHSFQGWIHP